MRRGNPIGRWKEGVGVSKDEVKKVDKGENYQNSSKLTEPERSVSNMRIIMRTVWGSKGVQSPLTRAVRSSASVRAPLSEEKLLA